MKHSFCTEDVEIVVELGLNICNNIYILNYIERDSYPEANNQDLEISKTNLSLWCVSPFNSGLFWF